MSSYKRTLVLLAIIFIFFGCAPQTTNLINNDYKYKKYKNESEFVLHALEYMKQGKIQKASILFLTLFNKTSNDEYLFEYSRLAFSMKKYQDIIINVENNKKHIKKNEDKIFKVYILSLIQEKQTEKAELELDNLLKKYNTNSNKSYWQILVY